MSFKIAVLGGDCVGPEVTLEAQRVLVAVSKRFGHDFLFTEAPVGGAALDAVGVPLPDETLNLCRNSDAILFGSIGGPRWDDNSRFDLRPGQALLSLRESLGLFANLRPVKPYPMLADKSPVRPEVVRGTDIMVVRELTGDVYFGQPKKRWVTPEGRRAVDTMDYSEREIARIVRVACELARRRKKRLTSVDKSNALITYRLWKEVTIEVCAEYPDIELSHILADNFAMQIVSNPTRFDVVVTGNLFGDIFTDEASVLAGSIGLLPSASLAGLPTGRALGLYEPIHGSAPDIAGKGIANPIAAILSAALLLRYSLGLEGEARAVEHAVSATLEAGYRTADIASPGSTQVGTREMAKQVIDRISTKED